MTSDSGHEAQKRMYTLYWWAKTGGPKKFGHDTFETTKEIDEYNADDLLSMVAGTLGSDTSDEVLEAKAWLKNFNAYYPLADFCVDFGVVKVVTSSEAEAKA